jgi:hypothetical protein
MRIAVAVVCLGLASAAEAAPVCRLRGQAWLEGRIAGADGPPRRTVDARLGQTLEVFVVAPGKLDDRAVTFSDAPGKGRVSWARAGCGELSVTWHRVEPRMEHVHTRAPNAEAVAVLAPCTAGAQACTPAPATPPLHWGRDLRPGDLLALDYVGFDGLPRPWDHIVALVEDRGPDGKPDGLLGPEDLVADSGDASGLKLAPLSDQGKVRVQVLRAGGVPLL